MHDRLLKIVENCLPFAAQSGQAFVRIPSSLGFRILPVHSLEFRLWFHTQFYGLYSTLPPPRAVSTIVQHVEALALFDASSRQGLAVFRRVASDANYVPKRILIDLANTEGRFIDISASGWKTTFGLTAPLEASRSTLSLPIPEPASSTPSSDPQPAPPALDTLRSCLNFPTRKAWLRALAWLLAALRPVGPFPILILQGPRSSGKSFAARILRTMIDPSAAPLIPLPAASRDLLTHARHNWVLAFDCISRLTPAVTETLGHLASGIGVAFRETRGPNVEPIQQHLRRPIVLCSDEGWACPASLAQRALIVSVPPLPSAVRIGEPALVTALDKAFPSILAALCNAVSTAIRRFAEFDSAAGHCPAALAWALATAPALGCTEDEMRSALGPEVPPHPMAEAVRALLAQRRQWTGTATELLDLLRPLVTCQTPKGVSQQLNQCALTLSDYGIELKFRRLTGGTRIIDLTEDPHDASFPQNAQDASLDSGPSPQPEQNEDLLAS